MTSYIIPIHTFEPGIRCTRLLSWLLGDVIIANNSYPWASNHFLFYTSMHLSLSIRLANTHSTGILNSNPLKSSIWVTKIRPEEVRDESDILPQGYLGTTPTRLLSVLIRQELLHLIGMPLFRCEQKNKKLRKFYVLPSGNHTTY